MKGRERLLERRLSTETIRFLHLFWLFNLLVLAWNKEDDVDGSESEVNWIVGKEIAFFMGSRFAVQFNQLKIVTIQIKFTQFNLKCGYFQRIKKETFQFCGCQCYELIEKAKKWENFVQAMVPNSGSSTIRDGWRWSNLPLSLSIVVQISTKELKVRTRNKVKNGDDRKGEVWELIVVVVKKTWCQYLLWHLVFAGEWQQRLEDDWMSP